MNATLERRPPPADWSALYLWAEGLRRALPLDDPRWPLADALRRVLAVRHDLDRRCPALAKQLSKTARMLADKIVEGEEGLTQTPPRPLK